MERRHLELVALNLNDESKFTESGIRRFLASQHHLTNALAVQLRVTWEGLAYFAEEPCVSDKCMEAHALVFESWPANCIGREGAEDNQWVAEVYRDLKAVWERYCRTGSAVPGRANYIDMW